MSEYIISYPILSYKKRHVNKERPTHGKREQKQKKQQKYPTKPKGRRHHAYKYQDLLEDSVPTPRPCNSNSALENYVIHVIADHVNTGVDDAVVQHLYYIDYEEFRKLAEEDCEDFYREIPSTCVGHFSTNYAKYLMCKVYDSLQILLPPILDTHIYQFIQDAILEVLENQYHGILYRNGNIQPKEMEPEQMDTHLLKDFLPKAAHYDDYSDYDSDY